MVQLPPKFNGNVTKLGLTGGLRLATLDDLIDPKSLASPFPASPLIPHLCARLFFSLASLRDAA
jgi:hypothetical protein